MDWEVTKSIGKWRLQEEIETEMEKERERERENYLERCGSQEVTHVLVDDSIPMYIASVLKRLCELKKNST